jgi:hypothetical protein
MSGTGHAGRRGGSEAQGDVPRVGEDAGKGRRRDMIICYALALSSLALVLSASTSYSGSCTQQIFDARSAAGKKLSDIAGAQPARPESTEAKLHRQPTPKSIAQAEGRFEIAVVAFEEAMKRAVMADDTHDLAKCENALTDARRILDGATR